MNRLPRMLECYILGGDFCLRVNIRRQFEGAVHNSAAQVGLKTSLIPQE